MRRPLPSQRARIVCLVLYAGGLVVVNWFLTGSWLPPVAAEGLWFYTAAVTLLLGDLVISPYYVGPKDALGVAVPAAVAIWFLLPSAADMTSPFFISATLAFCLGVAGIAIAAMLIPEARGERWSEVAKWLVELTRTVGHPKVILSLLFAVALVEFHIHSPSEILLVGGTWAVLVGLQPERPLYWAWQRLPKRTLRVADFGTAVGYRSPNLLLVRQESSDRVELGDLLICNDSRGPLRPAIALDFTGRDQGLLLRGLEMQVPAEAQGLLDVMGGPLGPDRVGKLREPQVHIPTGLKAELARFREEFVGIVAPNSDVERLYVEVVRERDLEEGHLLEVEIRGAPVLYQVVNGMTKEEIVHRKHKHGFARAEATKIGAWNENGQRFRRMKWLPNLNAPVFRASRAKANPDVTTVGHFPGTTYPVGLGSVSDLVTHNTAILGILGIGKSMLAIELVERMLAQGIKVVCLDLTNQYAVELSDWHDKEADRTSLERIQEAGREDLDDFAENPEEGGSFPNLKSAIAEDLVEFIASEVRYLKILNPAHFTATRQQSEPRSFTEGGAWHRRAALWSVTPVQITQVIAETLLEIVQDQMRDLARVCLVLEEAHSLVPEWNTVAQDADRNATNGTARAILQGRKYGFGTMLVTQRTANVTKTILNQCNTVFAMRTFDDTGKAFLANYLGATYADTLPTLAEREAVFFGKASTCENPVRIRLNDREDFLARFRDRFPAPFTASNAEESPVSDAESGQQLE